MSSQRLVFRNGFVVSMDPDIGEIPNGEVLVEDGVIVDVGSTSASPTRRRSMRPG